MSDFIEENKRMIESCRIKTGIDSSKVQKVVKSYLQIAKDNQMNYNELSRALRDINESVAYSLNMVSIEAMPDISENQCFNETEVRGMSDQKNIAVSAEPIRTGKVTVDTRDLDNAIEKLQKIRSLIQEINDLFGKTKLSCEITK